MKTVYAGGAVDYTREVEFSHRWRHRLTGLGRPVPGAVEWDVYCPLCANAGESDPLVIMQRNEIALFTADRCVFLLDGTFTVGTPVEIHQRLERRPADTVCIVHPMAEIGVFVRTWYRRGAAIVPDMKGARAWLKE